MARVFVTGGTGFVGRHIIKKAVKDGHTIVALIRSEEKAREVFKDTPGVEFVKGDINKKNTMIEGMKGCDAVIHLVGIIYEIKKKKATFEKIHYGGTRNVLKAVEKAGVKCYLHMSALGARPMVKSRYYKTKWAAEKLVTQSGLDWTIFRPSVIFGPEDDFINKFARMAGKPPFVPIVGDGQNKFQPIWVEDVASCYVQALKDKKTIGKAYGLAGPEVFTFEEIIKIILRVLGKKRLILKMPISLAKFSVKILERLMDPPPLSTDQLIMLGDDNICSQKMLCKPEMIKKFDIEHKRLEETIKDYL
jgi:NADH dehydrogenase